MLVALSVKSTPFGGHSIPLESVTLHQAIEGRAIDTG
jgi:hypothetical protein